MTEEKAAAVSAEQENQQALDALERALRRADGFALYFMRCNLPALRRDALKHLGAQTSDTGRAIVEIDLEEPVTDLIAVLEQRPQEVPALAVSLSGLELSIPADEQPGTILAALNVERETFPTVLPCPLLIWLPEFAMRRLAQGAPDFYAWRSGEYQLRAVGRDGLLTAWQDTKDDSGGLRNLSRAARARRSEALRGLIAELSEGSKAPGCDLASALRDLAELARVEGELDTARRYLVEALAEADKTPNADQEQLRVLSAIGRVARDLGAFRWALYYLERRLLLARDLADPSKEARADWDIAATHLLAGDPDRAEVWWRHSLELARKGTSRAAEAKALQGVAIVCAAKRDYAQVASLLQGARELARKSQLRASEQAALHVAAVLWRNAGEYARAEESAEEAVAVAQACGDKAGEADLLQVRAGVLEAQGDLAAAVEDAWASRGIYLNLGLPERREAEELAARLRAVLMA